MPTFICANSATTYVKVCVYPSVYFMHSADFKSHRQYVNIKKEKPPAFVLELRSQTQQFEKKSLKV